MKKFMPFFILIFTGIAMLLYSLNINKFLVDCSYYLFVIDAVLVGYYINGFIKNKSKTFLISLILSFIIFIIYYFVDYFIISLLFYLTTFINLICCISIIFNKIVKKESVIIYYFVDIILFGLSLLIITFTKSDFVYFLFTLINSLSIFYFLSLVIVNVLYKSKI